MTKVCNKTATDYCPHLKMNHSIRIVYKCPVMVNNSGPLSYRKVEYACNENRNCDSKNECPIYFKAAEIIYD